MPASILNGSAISKNIKARLKEEISVMERKPGLAVLMVGANPAGLVYVRNRAKACQAVGIDTFEVHLPYGASEEEVIAEIEKLNADDSVDGILVECPLPAHINQERVLRYLRSDKDVDGITVENSGKLFTKGAGFVPCTPYGVMALIKETRIPIRGKTAVVVGRSSVVGKPMAMMLLQEDATVTLTHSKTIDLGSYTRQADILVVAVGKAGLITQDMVKPGAIVIDVGINITDQGKMVGDVDYDKVSQIAGWLTPVPGGVGPVTVAMLLQNTLTAAKKHMGLCN